MAQLLAHDYLELIRAKGLTQAEIETRTGIPQGTISKIERGKVDDVMSKTYLALKALHDEIYPEQRRSTDPLPKAALTQAAQRGV